MKSITPLCFGIRAWENTPRLLVSIVTIGALMLCATAAQGESPRSEDPALPTVNAELVDRIQRESLRSYTPEMLKALTSSEATEIPPAIDESPEEQNEWLDRVISMDKGLFYPILLEDLWPAFEAFIEPGDRFLDLGSGDGRVVFFANVLGADAYGIEYEPSLIEVSHRATEKLEDIVDRDRLHFIEGDFFEHSWAEYDVIYFFDLSSFEHHRVRKKLIQELKPGAHLIVGHQRAPYPGLALETVVDGTYIYRQPEVAMNDTTLVARSEREIADMHQALQDWYNGSVPNDEKTFSRLADVLARGFTGIDADGRTIHQKGYLQKLRGEYGRWQVTSGEPGQGKITVKNVRARLVNGPLAVFIFQVVEEASGKTEITQRSALFQLHHGLPNGVEWYHLQSTRMPPR